MQEDAIVPSGSGVHRYTRSTRKYDWGHPTMKGTSPGLKAQLPSSFVMLPSPAFVNIVDEWQEFSQR